MPPQDIACFLYASPLRGRHHCEKMRERERKKHTNVKRGKAVAWQLPWAPWDVFDMEWDPGSNILYICHTSARHHLIGFLHSLCIQPSISVLSCSICETESSTTWLTLCAVTQPFSDLSHVFLCLQRRISFKGAVSEAEVRDSSVEMLQCYLTSIIESIVGSVDQCPPVMRVAFKQLHKRVEEQFAEPENEVSPEWNTMGRKAVTPFLNLAIYLYLFLKSCIF